MSTGVTSSGRHKSTEQQDDQGISEKATWRKNCELQASGKERGGSAGWRQREGNY